MMSWVLKICIKSALTQTPLNNLMIIKFWAGGFHWKEGRGYNKTD